MAGTLVTAARKMIYQEGARFRSAVSEELIQRLGAAINFINQYQHSEKQFFVNGNYSLVPLPFTGIDGITFFQSNAEILDTWMYVQTAGSAGTTELDLELAASPGGAWSSIFTTTPKITAAAGSYRWIHLGSVVAGTTAPVLGTVNVNAGSALRCKIVQAQSGSAIDGCGIVVHYRPR